MALSVDDPAPKGPGEAEVSFPPKPPTALWPALLVGMLPDVPTEDLDGEPNPGPSGEPNNPPEELFTCDPPADPDPNGEPGLATGVLGKSSPDDPSGLPDPFPTLEPNELVEEVVALGLLGGGDPNEKRPLPLDSVLALGNRLPEAIAGLTWVEKTGPGDTPNRPPAVLLPAIQPNLGTGEAVGFETLAGKPSNEDPDRLPDAVEERVPLLDVSVLPKVETFGLLLLCGMPPLIGTDLDMRSWSGATEAG